jgi:hypothetical protein
MPIKVIAVGRPEVPTLFMPDAFRAQITYFMSVPGQAGVPSLPAGEYWIDLEQAKQWLADGAFLVVSPLDSATKTEVELTEEQENWLQWMVDHEVRHVRLM